MQPAPSRLPVDDAPGDPQILLRDGRQASVRAATADDRSAVERLCATMPADERAATLDILVRAVAPATTPASSVLVVEHQTADGLHVVAAAGALVTTVLAADVAFAVDPAWQGLGLATALLERVAATSASRGIRTLRARMRPDNDAMRRVLYDSGFGLRAHTAGTVADVHLSLTLDAVAERTAAHRDQLATAASLRPLLRPRAVAVIGVSRDPQGIGHRIVTRLKADGFRGPIHPVSRSLDAVDGTPCLASARDLPPGVDLAVIAVPAASVPSVVDDCAAAGVRALVVISAGFAETGPDGVARQAALAAQVRRLGLRLVGPNCLGVLNGTADVRLNASFSPVMPSPGRVALLSQSGGLGIAIIELANARGIGLSSVVSAGNKADVSANDLLQYWATDPDTSVALLYLEGFGNPRRFARLARHMGRTTPIVALKAGRTGAGSRAAGSHTAALAASDVAVDALFAQTGVIRARTVDEMFDIAACLEAQPLPRGARVALLTNAGGPGILAADACEAAGLTLATLSPTTQQRLRATLPADASIGNPIDMVASAGPTEYRTTIATLLADPGVDALVVIYTPVQRGAIADTVGAITDGVADARAAGHLAVPVLAVAVAEPDGSMPMTVCYTTPSHVDGSGTTVRECVPVYRFPENAINALGHAVRYARWRAEPESPAWVFEDAHLDDARALCQAVVAARGASWLTPEETRRVLQAAGLPLVPSVLVQSADDAVAVATVLGLPVVAKLQSHAVLHKSDVGAVMTDLRSEHAVREAFTALAALVPLNQPLRAANGEGIILQPMVHGGLETLIGITHDPLFGPLIAFGLGGVAVELLGDVGFGVAPLTERDADRLLAERRSARLLSGYRGHAPADIPALRDVLLRVSQLAEAVPELAELDLNPVLALAPGLGCRIVDARIRVGPASAPQPLAG